MEKTTAYLSNLTPLRGIAALLTVIFHVDLFMGNGSGALVHLKDSLLLTRMYLMVDFFFILSGFILLHVYGKWFADGVTWSEFKRFTVARFARVYPLHFVTLIYTIILLSTFHWLGVPKNPILEVENHPYSVVTNLLLLQSMNLHQWFSWVHASWSISTEWWMYMLFPFLVIPFSKLKSIGQVAVALVSFGGYVAIMFYIIPLVTLPKELSFMIPSEATFAGSINVAFQYGFLRCLFGFVLGMMLYKGYQKEWGKAWLANGYTLLLATIGLLLCLHFAVADVFTVSFYPFILLSAAYGSPRIDTVFSTKPMQRLGDWSFSIYLVHQPLLFTITAILAYLNPIDPNTAPAGPPPTPGLLTAWIICVIFIALTLFISYLTYRFVEVPARGSINKRFKPAKVLV